MKLTLFFLSLISILIQSVSWSIQNREMDLEVANQYRFDDDTSAPYVTENSMGEAGSLPMKVTKTEMCEFTITENASIQALIKR